MVAFLPDASTVIFANANDSMELPALLSFQMQIIPRSQGKQNDVIVA
jgi:hypothetical protein